MVFEMFATLVNPIFSPLLALQPHIALFLLSALLTSLVFGINRLMINRKVAKEIKTKLAEIKENLTKAQKEGRKDDVSKFLNEYMSMNNKYLRQTFKVMIVSFIVLMLVFPWVNKSFSGIAVGILPFALPIIGTKINWIVWYIFISIMVSWLLKKFIGE